MFDKVCITICLKIYMVVGLEKKKIRVPGVLPTNKMPTRSRHFAYQSFCLLDILPTRHGMFSSFKNKGNSRNSNIFFQSGLIIYSLGKKKFNL